MSSPESPDISGSRRFAPHHQISDADGFDIVELVSRRIEPALEVAGPTGYGDTTGLAAYAVWHRLEPPSKLFVSNKYTVPPHSSPDKLDLQLDAGRLPFRDTSLGIIAASALWEFEMRAREPVYGLHERFMAEARRCLVPDGLLVMTTLEPGWIWSVPERLGLTVLRVMQPSHDQWLQQAIFMNRPPGPGQTYTTIAIDPDV